MREIRLVVSVFCMGCIAELGSDPEGTPASPSNEISAGGTAAALGVDHYVRLGDTDIDVVMQDASVARLTTGRLDGLQTAQLSIRDGSVAEVRVQPVSATAYLVELVEGGVVMRRFEIVDGEAEAAAGSQLRAEEHPVLRLLLAALGDANLRRLQSGVSKTVNVAGTRQAVITPVEWVFLAGMAVEGAFCLYWYCETHSDHCAQCRAWWNACAQCRRLAGTYCQTHPGDPCWQARATCNMSDSCALGSSAVCSSPC